MASGSIRARSVARNIIDPTMVRIMIREEVRRIAWRVSISGVERPLTTSVTRSGVLLWDQRRRCEATCAARGEAGRDLALPANEPGGKPGGVALDLAGPADGELRAARAVE